MSAPTRIAEMKDIVEDYWNSRSVNERERILIAMGRDTTWTLTPFMVIPGPVQENIQRWMVGEADYGY